MTSESHSEITSAVPAAEAVAAPRTTAVLAQVLVLGILLQGTFAGGFLGGHSMWLDWHEGLGNALLFPPLVSLVTGLVLRRRQPEKGSMLGERVALLLLVLLTIAAGHKGGGLLAVHIPAVLLAIVLAVRHATIGIRRS